MSLDQRTAKKREAIIRKNSIQYNLNFILQPDRYSGIAEITFIIDSLSFDQYLELDFTGRTIEGFLINNIQLQPERKENFILLPKTYLQKGKNRLSVLYESGYDHDQAGLISFVDENKEQFVFTDFEPYFANRVFPCFDQPNLKARMTLTVITENPWIALSHDKPTSIQSIQQHRNFFKLDQQTQHMRMFFNKVPSNSMTITKFPKTKLMPSYIMCFAAGNYYEVPSNLPGVPMSLYCPLSVIDTVNNYSKFIFDISSKCMKLYEAKFKTPYPFSKYDQIFIREGHFVGMENPGLVTLDESYCLPKENPTKYDYYYLALLVAHQLSHHWFGNYVTMKWWDDVWLNESFAEWVSCYILDEFLKGQVDYPYFDSSYFYFRDIKVRGYIQDERNTATHPIRGIVNNTDEASSVFDGITYEKGASTLKQLAYLVGIDKFFQALGSYFDRFQWDNASIDDLLDDISQVFPSTQVKLTDWKKLWLEEPSLNVFRTDWDRANHKLTLKQSSFDGLNVLRPHQIKIALFKKDCSFDVIQDQLILAVPSTEIVYDGSTNYTAILINHDDETFAENIIDPVSLAFFMSNIDKIKDTFTRMMVWYNIRSMVNIGQITISDYVTFIRNKLPSEPSNFVVDRILQSLHQYLSNYIDQNNGNALKRMIWHMVYIELRAVDDTEKERITILQNQFIQYARSELELYNLQDWLYNKDPSLRKRTPDFKQKWNIVKKLYTHPGLSLQQKQDAFTQVYAIDFDTYRIDEATTVCKVLLATETEFQAIYEQFKGQSVSLAVKKVKVEGWRNACRADWLNKYLQRYFNDIIEVSQTLSYDQFKFFYTRLAPINNDYQYQIRRYNDVIAALQAKGNMKEHVRNIRKLVDDLTQKVKNNLYNAEIDTALSLQRAIFKESYIKKGSISYNFHISFVKVDGYYTGMAEISFFLQDIPLILPLDFIYDTLYSLKVNGAKIDPNSKGQFLYIPGSNLLFGANFISIHYKNKYNNDGLGCMSYIETDTAKQYIYTKFEPYGAHRFIPCFDQPDLKAKAVFNVIVPIGWKVIGNQTDAFSAQYDFDLYKSKVSTRDQALLNSYLQSKSGVFFNLEETQSISTYLYCIVAGQYYKVSATAQQAYKDLSINAYCIESYSKALDRLAPFIFEMTKLSLQLYETRFQTPYQFNKYDSVFCHQFKSGAMENPGVITFNDTYLYPDEVSLQKMVQFASTIVHQNSHNWFGNFVTMKWWDDLWLNESFADFMAYYCLESIKGKVTTIDKFDSGWKFFLMRGVVGYRQDQITETTHAVRSTVQNTSIATTYFDRITYQKGSATLKQLMFLMGEEPFFLGVKDYFDAFGWSNGTIDDFLGKMQTHFDNPNFTLNDWKQSWLLTPSLNTMEIEWDSSITTTPATLKIKQNYYTPVYPQLRYHKTKIALFFDDSTKQPDLFEIELTPNSEFLFQYDGSKNYKAVLLNAEYWGYFKYTIDPVSLQYFQDNINKIPDALTKSIIWHDINEQMRDAKYKIQDFVDLFLASIFQQKDDKIFENEFAIMKDVANGYTPIDKRGDLKSKIFDATYQNLINYPGKSDKVNRVKLLKDQLTIFASTNDQILLLDEWMTDQNQDLKGLQITILQTCDVLKLFYTLDESPTIKYQRYMDQLMKIGATKGQLTLNTCNTIIANDQQYDTIYNFFKDMTRSLDVKLSYGQGWSYLSHLDLYASIYKKRYFADLPLLSKQLNSNHFESFYQNLKPFDDNLEETVAEYGKIKLEGANNIGHMKVLTQLKYNYQLRLDLYNANQLNH